MSASDRALLAAALLIGCGGSPTPAPTAPSERDVTAPTASAGTPTARAVTDTELSRAYACGPFRSDDVETVERSLLNDRVKFRFFTGARTSGGADSGKVELSREGATMFFGARELHLRGGPEFARRAAIASSFGGTHEPIIVVGSDGQLPISAGVLKSMKSDRDGMTALAHGWFVDENDDVLDVAVFASASAVTDLEACRGLAQRLLHTVARGPRKLARPPTGEVETKVSYATFRYTLPNDWILVSSEGIHDFARMRFRKRGPFPDGGVDLQLALDSHPGDWASPGADSGTRNGRLLGVPVSWRLTSSGEAAGAWTISTQLHKGDHAVASLQATTVAERDAAIEFAESIRVGK